MKKILIWGGTGQIGTHLIRKLTQNNYTVTVVTRNIHQKGHIIKTQGNAGYIDLKELQKGLKKYGLKLSIVSTEKLLKMSRRS